MIPLAEIVYRAALKANLPILGVSIGTPTDRTTWSISYAPTATDDDRRQGDALLATVNVTDPLQLAPLRAERAGAEYAQNGPLQAVAQALWESIPAPRLTLAQLTARVIALWPSS